MAGLKLSVSFPLLLRDAFKEASLDLLYLDGRHNYEGVKEDLEAWYSKIRPGGIICGHDYLNETIGNTVFGVKQAVDEFATALNLKPLITDKDIYPSWFILKPVIKAA